MTTRAARAQETSDIALLAKKLSRPVDLAPKRLLLSEVPQGELQEP